MLEGAPLLFIALLMLALPLCMQLLGRRRGTRQPIDIGVLFGWVVAIYGAVPLIGISLALAGIGTIQEQRLGEDLPDSARVREVGLLFLAFLGGFSALYAATRTPWTLETTPLLPRPSGSAVIVALVTYLGIQAGVALIRWMYGLGSGTGEQYLDSYAELYTLPLVVQQFLGVLTAADFAAAVLLIVTVIAWRPGAHRWVALGVVLLVIETFVAGGSRSYAFLCGLTYVVARSVYGPRLPLAALLALGVVGLLAFSLAGAIRSLLLDGESVSALGLLQGGEFVAFFYNGLDLAERATDIRSPELSLGLYLVDLLRLLPRQLVGDVKVDPAVFYVSTFYPEFYEAGGGLAFGAIAEAALGYGVPEALVRGALLGLLYGWLRNRLNVPQPGVLRVFVYTWFVVMAYQGLRDTTFSVFPRFVLQVLPVLALVWLSGSFSTRRPARLPELEVAGQSPA